LGTREDNARREREAIERIKAKDRLKARQGTAKRTRTTLDGPMGRRNSFGGSKK
jgi:hypothetical protein